MWPRFKGMSRTINPTYKASAQYFAIKRLMCCQGAHKWPIGLSTKLTLVHV
jgi:hypothetical protein